MSKRLFDFRWIEFLGLENTLFPALAETGMQLLDVLQVTSPSRDFLLHTHVWSPVQLSGEVLFVGPILPLEAK